MNSPMIRNYNSGLLSRRQSLALIACGMLFKTGDSTSANVRRVIVPFEVGGGIDSVARLLSNVAASDFDSLVILNRAGASGNIGTAVAARAAPDGTTLLVTGSSHFGGPIVLPNAGYDPLKDFIPLVRLALAPNVLLVNESLRGVPLMGPIGVKPLIHRSLNFAIAGFASTSQLAAEKFRRSTGVSWSAVPYQGTGPAMRALMAGEVQVMFAPISAVAIALQTGRVHAVGSAHETRLPSLPEVPTLRELGVTGAENSQWYGVLMPAGASPSVAEAMSQMLFRIASTPSFLKGLRQLGLEDGLMTRTVFERFFAEESDRVSALLAGLPIERPGK